MKGVIFRRVGGPDVLEYTDLADPTAGDGQILIKVAAISVEAGDITRRQHGPLPTSDRAIGYVAAGEVRAVGAGVTQFRLGQKVTTFDFDGGAYAEFRTAPASTCWAVPDGMDMPTAAGALAGFGTAADALSIAQPKAGQSVMVQGAAGGVGIALVQSAHLAGLRVLATSSSAASLATLAAHGLDDGILIGETPVSEQARRLTGGRGVDILLDNVGGTAFEDGLRAVADGGRAVIIGVPTGFPQIDCMQLLLRRLTVSGCYLAGTFGEPEQRRLVDDALAKIAAGKLRVFIDRTYRLAEVAAAHGRSEERGHLGKIILLP